MVGLEGEKIAQAYFGCWLSGIIIISLTEFALHIGEIKRSSDCPPFARRADSNYIV